MQGKIYYYYYYFLLLFRRRSQTLHATRAAKQRIRCVEIGAGSTRHTRVSLAFVRTADRSQVKPTAMDVADAWQIRHRRSSGRGHDNSWATSSVTWSALSWTARVWQRCHVLLFRTTNSNFDSPVRVPSPRFRKGYWNRTTGSSHNTNILNMINI